MEWLSKPVAATVQPQDVCVLKVCYEVGNTGGGCGINFCVNKSCFLNY